MPKSKSAPKVEVSAKPDTLSVSEPLVEYTPVVSVTNAPGAPVETVADKEANDKVRAEKPIDTKVPEVPALIETSSPEANLASRSNIVADGPGTVADFIG